MPRLRPATPKPKRSYGRRSRPDAGALDVLINNAGYRLVGPLAEIKEEDFRDQFETNVFGLMAVTRAFLPHLERRGQGRILNVSSIGGRTTFPFFGAYHASKYAVEALSDVLRLELAPLDIDVVLIEPGPILSGFADRSIGLLEQYRGNSRSLYAPIYARADEIRTATERRAASPAVTSRAIERAITARRPRARYVVPVSSRLLLAPLSLLPTRLVDEIIRRAVGLSPALRTQQRETRAEVARAEAERLSRRPQAAA